MSWFASAARLALLGLVVAAAIVHTGRADAGLSHAGNLGSTRPPATPGSETGTATVALCSSVGRYYDPQTGQFLSLDPLLDRTGAPYAYVNGDPVNRNDPSGEDGPGEDHGEGFGPGFAESADDARSGYIDAADQAREYGVVDPYVEPEAAGIPRPAQPCVFGAAEELFAEASAAAEQAAEDGAMFGQRGRGLLLDESGQLGGFSIKGRLKTAQLPSSGRIRYVPPTGYKPTMPLPRGASNGYIDRFGNEWVRGPSRTPGEPFEWDVQLSRTGREQLGWLSSDGSHVNVSLGGRVTH